MTSEQQALIAEWLEAKRAVDETKPLVEKERALRMRVAIECFEYGEGELREGTERHHIKDGYHVAGKFSITYGFKKPDEVRAVLDEIEQSSPAGAFLADRIVRWKPELDAREYKAAPPEIRDLINSVLTKKQALPTIDLEAPKVAK